ncbi:uncharacterized protein DC041_0010559 [Schistosoma bovis]|uniref:Kinesin motor domain-containing protein n=1 Tax=Schistosoma bovis TaxID=6184 RepID=A0A430QIC7_SCHBO|nr:uncharacterized protein DC041_0010559 [Schistosoma bovis]
MESSIIVAVRIRPLTKLPFLMESSIIVAVRIRPLTKLPFLMESSIIVAVRIRPLTKLITGPPDDPGIIRRISKDMFEEIGRRTLVVREHPVTGPYIDGLLCEEVCSESDIIKRLDFGNRLRAVAATPLNENSSRSHTVLVLSLTKRSTTKCLLGDIENVFNSHITIVDLAGSERQTSTSTLSGRFIVSLYYI